MDPFTIVMILGGYVLARKLFGEKPSSTVTAFSERIAAPKKVVTLVGATGSGKSSTANALLGYEAFHTGAEHGTTVDVLSKPYQNDYCLQDTPGILDNDGLYIPQIVSAIQDSELTVYVTTGQLYKSELEFLGNLFSRQKYWDQKSNTPGRRQLACFVNKTDIRDQTLDSSSREREIRSLRQQLSSWVPSDKIVVGASSPCIDGVRLLPRISELKRLISTHIQANQ